MSYHYIVERDIEPQSTNQYHCAPCFTEKFGSITWKSAMNRRVSMAWSGVFLEPNWTAQSSGKPTSWTHWPLNSCPTGCTMWPTIWECPDREPSPHSSRRATSWVRGWCTPETPTTTRWVGHVTTVMWPTIWGCPDRESLPPPGELVMWPQSCDPQYGGARTGSPYHYQVSWSCDHSHVTHNMGVPGQGVPTTTRWVGHVTTVMWPSIWGCPDRESLPPPDELVMWPQSCDPQYGGAQTGSPYHHQMSWSCDHSHVTHNMGVPRQGAPTTTRWVGHVTSHVIHNMGVPRQGVPTTTRWVGHVTTVMWPTIWGCRDREPLPPPGELVMWPQSCDPQYGVLGQGVPTTTRWVGHVTTVMWPTIWACTNREPLPPPGELVMWPQSCDPQYGRAQTGSPYHHQVSWSCDHSHVTHNMGMSGQGAPTTTRWDRKSVDI